MANPLKAQGQWPSLAQDMALLTIPNSPVQGVDDVCATYNLTQAELKEILTVPYFQKLFERALQDVQALGSAAGVKYRAMILSQTLAEHLFRQANNGELEARDALKLLELLFKASGLEKDNTATAKVNTQVNIALPIPHGITKVAHCIAPLEQTDV